MEDTGVLNLDVQQWLDDLGHEPTARHPNKRFPTTDEREMLLRMVKRGRKKSEMLRKWVEGHERFPTAFGPAPTRDTLNVILKDLEEE